MKPTVNQYRCAIVDLLNEFRRGGAQAIHLDALLDFPDEGTTLRQALETIDPLRREV